MKQDKAWVITGCTPVAELPGTGKEIYPIGQVVYAVYTQRGIVIVDSLRPENVTTIHFVADGKLYIKAMHPYYTPHLSDATRLANEYLDEVFG